MIKTAAYAPDQTMFYRPAVEPTGSVKPTNDRYVPKPPVMGQDQWLRKDWGPAIDRAYQQAADAGWTPESQEAYAQVVLAAARQDVRTRSLSPERAALAVDTATDAGWSAAAANREDRRTMHRAAQQTFNSPSATAEQKGRAQAILFQIAVAEQDDTQRPVPLPELPISAMNDGAAAPAGGSARELADARNEGRKDVFKGIAKALIPFPITLGVSAGQYLADLAGFGKRG